LFRPRQKEAARKYSAGLGQKKGISTNCPHPSSSANSSAQPKTPGRGGGGGGVGAMPRSPKSDLSWSTKRPLLRRCRARPLEIPGQSQTRSQRVSTHHAGYRVIVRERLRDAGQDGGETLAARCDETRRVFRRVTIQLPQTRPRVLARDPALRHLFRRGG